MIYSYVITNQYDNFAVKRYLKDTLCLSTRAINKVKYGNILVNDVAVTVAHQLKRNDILTIILEEAESSDSVVPNSDDVKIPIIYQDEYLVAVNKPPHMNTHPSLREPTTSLINYLAYQLNLTTLHIATRLDRDTSGVVLIAKDAITSQKLNEQLKNQTMRKSYIAIVDGVIKQDCVIDCPIRRMSVDSVNRIVADDGQTATTLIHILDQYITATKLAVTPTTGRTHQIRVHLQHICHSILGDKLYGSPCPYIDRQALHMSRLIFTHPHTSNIISVNAPLPDDISQLIEQLQKPSTFK